MKKYKIRIDCTSFEDIVVEATDKEDAISQARTKFICPDSGHEVGEFLPVEEGE